MADFPVVDKRNEAYLWALKTLDKNDDWRLQKTECEEAEDTYIAWDGSWGGDSVGLTKEFAGRVPANPQLENYVLRRLGMLFRQFFGKELKSHLVSKFGTVKGVFSDGVITSGELPMGEIANKVFKRIGDTAEDGIDIHELVELTGEGFYAARNAFAKLCGGWGNYDGIARDAWKRLCLAAAEQRLDLTTWNNIVGEYGLSHLVMNEASFTCIICQQSGAKRVGSVFRLSKAIVDFYISATAGTGAGLVDTGVAKDLCLQDSFDVINMETKDSKKCPEYYGPFFIAPILLGILGSIGLLPVILGKKDAVYITSGVIGGVGVGTGAFLAGFMLWHLPKDEEMVAFGPVRPSATMPKPSLNQCILNFILEF